jgi:CIC family chloride channel protein
MLTTVIAYTVARQYERDSLYSGWLRRRGERLEHGRDDQILARLRVSEVVEKNPQVIGESAQVAELLHHLGNGTQTEFPVVDTELRLRGVITVADLARVAHQQAELASVLVAADLAAPAEFVRPTDSLRDAVRVMGTRGLASLPVVEGDDGRLIGITRHADIMALYERVLAAE